MITIEFSFAWLFCVLMVLITIMILYGIFITPKDTVAIIVLGVGLILLLDLFCAFGSALYMSHPTNGDIRGRISHTWCDDPDNSKCGDGNVYASGGTWYSDGCSNFNSSIGAYDPVVECIAPTPQDNPYEKQPLHPIAWILGGMWDLGKLTTGAVKFKVT